MRGPLPRDTAGIKLWPCGWSSPAPRIPPAYLPGTLYVTFIHSINVYTFLLAKKVLVDLQVDQILNWKIIWVLPSLMAKHILDRSPYMCHGPFAQHGGAFQTVPRARSCYMDRALVTLGTMWPSMAVPQPCFPVIPELGNQRPC